MPKHELYQKAMEQIAPRPEWKADTLQKLAAERQKQAQGAPRRAVAFPKRWVPLAVAAAAALVVIPAALRQGGQSMDTAGAETAQACDTDENYAAPREGGGVSGAYEPRMARLFNGPRNPVQVEFNTRIQPGRALPVIPFGGDAGGLGGQVTYLAPQARELADANPTRDLPPQQLPAQLPVWYAPCGPEHGAQLEVWMQSAAEYLGLTLWIEPDEASPADGLLPDCWPYAARGVLAEPGYDPEQPAAGQTGAVLWWLDASGATLTLDNRWAEQVGQEERQSHSRERQEEAATQALEAFGTLAGIRDPQLECTLEYNFDGTPVYHSSYFEGAEPGDSVQERLLKYSFRRVDSGYLAADGVLTRCRLTLPPQAPMAGLYPLQSVQQAAQQLEQAILADRECGIVDYPLSAADVVSWAIVYDWNWRNPWIQPVYEFTLETPLTPAQAFYQGETVQGNKVYVKYRVPALLPEYSVPWEEAFN